MAERIFFIEEHCPGIRENNAGSKAREDVSTILETAGLSKIKVPYDLSLRLTSNIFTRLNAHISTVKDWDEALSTAQSGDSVIVQFPLLHHSVFAKKAFITANKRGVKIILFIHDLDFIRLGSEKTRSIAAKLRIRAEELSLLESASMIIVHNNAMKNAIMDSCNISPDRIIALQIFDYLIADDTERAKALGPQAPVIIAGNLNKKKAGYIRNLPSDVEFNLYGFGYEADDYSNIHYRGEFTPEELTSKLEGSFGLIWDGPCTATCTGAYGSYLRINNPHKTSLYLAAGLPVVIWNDAALTTFVKENEIGIAVSNLNELAILLGNISDEKYAQMKSNVESISLRLRNGYFTEKAVKQSISGPML